MASDEISGSVKAIMAIIEPSAKGKDLYGLVDMGR
jgi:hypothetical protein